MKKLIRLVYLIYNYSEYVLRLQNNVNCRQKSKINLRFFCKNPCRSQYCHNEFFNTLDFVFSLIMAFSILANNGICDLQLSKIGTIKT